MTQSYTYFVSGAGRDIGRGIAEGLVRENSFAILHYANSSEGAEEALEIIRHNGGDGITLQADFTRTEAIEDFTEQVIQSLDGRKLDTIVHNAACTSASPPGALDIQTLGNVLKGNILFPYLLTDALADYINDGASIIAISVGATRKVFSPDFGFFCASKSAVETLVQNWAVQFGPRKIRANAVAPGVVDANFRSGLLQDETFKNNLENMTALGRPGRIEDIVKVIQFLASGEAGWITGDIIDVSGGWKL